MDIFLSAELDSLASSRWFPLQKEFRRKLSCLEQKFYGDELTSVAIISIIMDPKYFEDGGYKERILYRRRTSEADVRLRIPWKEFVFSKPDLRRKIYINHILESIEVLRTRVGSQFKLDELKKDIYLLLNDSCDSGKSFST